MRSVSSMHAVLAVLLASCGGCGDGGGGNNGGNNGGVNNGATANPGTLRQVLGEMCDFIERCPSGDFALAYGSRAECVDILDFVLTCRVVREGDDDFETVGVEQVPIPISATQQSACIDWLRGLECGTGFGGESTPCDFLGSAFGDDNDGDYSGARRGEICERENCAPGLECVESAREIGEEDFCRICVAPGGPGAPCANPSRPCEEGLQCNWNLGVCDYPLLEGEDCSMGDRACGEELFCHPDDRVCLPLLDDGEPCMFTSAGQDWICQSQFCNENTGNCDAGGEVGDACTNEDDCRLRGNGSCDDGVCAAPSPNGSPCESNADCARRNCHAETGRCGDPDGSDCFNSDRCASGYCNRRTDACEPTRALGESCTDYEACGLLATCQYVSHSANYQICMSRCEETADCPAEHVCDGGGCKPLQAEGGACDGDEDCLTGWCSDSERCGIKPGIGDACESSGDCYPRGWCSGGVCVAKLGPGEACSGYESCMEPYVCLEGECERIGLVCIPAAIGERCTWLQVCEEGAYCNVFDNFRCAAQKGAGESCTRSNECLGDLVCGSNETGRVCVETAAEGDECGQVPCTPGLWCDYRIQPSVCARLKNAGEDCTDSDECGEEAYCDGEVCISDNPELTCTLPEEG